MTNSHFKKVTVVGCGLMGKGIALELACARLNVELYGRSSSKLSKAVNDIENLYEDLKSNNFFLSEHNIDLRKHIQINTSLKESVTASDLIIETVAEDISIKKEIFTQIDRYTPEDAIIASNTSSIPPSEFAKVVTRPERVLVAHYFNPPYLIPLVEIVKHPSTSEEVVRKLKDFLIHFGKSPIVMQKELTGFIANRLQYAIFREAMYMVKQGAVSPEDIDAVMKLCLGKRWAYAGPFELFNLAGWHIVESIMPIMLPELSNDNSIVDVLVKDENKDGYGIKFKNQIHHWSQEETESFRKELRKKLISIFQENKISNQ